MTIITAFAMAIPDCIIMEDKNGRQGKGYPNPDQTCQAEFNELVFISIALKLNQNFMDSLTSDREV